MDRTHTDASTHTRRFLIAAAIVLTMAVVWLGFLGRTALTDNRVRTQVSTGAGLGWDLQPVVIGYFVKNHAYPTNNLEAGLPAPRSISSEFTSSVSIANGRIIVTFGKNADLRIAGRRLVLSPRTRGDNIVWSCDRDAGTTIEPKYRPSTCR